MILICLGSISSSQPCEKKYKDCINQVDKCTDALKDIYDRCQDQMKQDAKIITKQKKTIKKLDKEIDKNTFKHRAQGFGVGTVLVMLLFLLL